MAILVILAILSTIDGVAQNVLGANSWYKSNIFELLISLKLHLKYIYSITY